MSVDSDIAALRREITTIRLELAALQARVYTDRPVMTPEDRTVADKLLADLARQKEEREQREKETPVHIDAEDWEKGWMLQ